MHLNILKFLRKKDFTMQEVFQRQNHVGIPFPVWMG